MQLSDFLSMQLSDFLNELEYRSMEQFVERLENESGEKIMLDFKAGVHAFYFHGLDDSREKVNEWKMKTGSEYAAHCYSFGIEWAAKNLNMTFNEKIEWLLQFEFIRRVEFRKDHVIVFVIRPRLGLDPVFGYGINPVEQLEGAIKSIKI